MHLGKVHLWIICHQQWWGIVLAFLQQSCKGVLAFIFSAFKGIEKHRNGKGSGEIDAKDTCF